MIKTAKKALAFTLAASMAFSVAPVAPLASNIALAAEAGTHSSITNIVLSIGNEDATKNSTYQSLKLDKATSVAGYSSKVKVADKAVALIGVAKDSADIPTLADLNAGTAGADAKIDWKDEVTITSADTQIFVKAVDTTKAASTEISITSDGVTGLADQTISVAVQKASQSFKVTGADDKEITNNGSVSVVAGQDVVVTLVGDNIKDILDGLAEEGTDTSKSRFVVADKTVATATYTDHKLTISGAKAGATNIKIYINELNTIFTLTVNVIADTELTATIDGKTYVAKADNKWTLDGKEATPVVYLTQSNQSASVAATANSGAKVTYTPENETYFIVGNDGSISAKLDSDSKVIVGKAKVTIKAEANATSGQSARTATVDVVVIPETKKLVSVSVAGSDGKTIASGEVKVTGIEGSAAKLEVKTTDSETVKLSTKDKTSEAITITSNVNANRINVSVSGDDKIVKYENGTLTAVGKGTATVTVKADPEVDFETESVTLTFDVTVSDKFTDNEIVVTGAPIILTEKQLTGTVSASAKYGNTLSYELATKKDGKYEVVTDKYSTIDISLNATTKEVTYKNNGSSGTIYVKVSSASAVETAENPEPVYVEVQYGALKESDLSIAAKKITATIGDTVSAGAKVTGQELEYVSDDATVATVAADGTITAVGAGTAVITVKAIGNGVYKSAEKDITVVVSAKAKAVNPITVAAKKATVKYSKVKKAKVTLAVSKVLTIKNAKGTKTFTKKSGNAKITINKSTGKVTIKKGLKKGTYSVKVAVKAAGNASYKAKTVTKTFKVVVK